MSLDPQLEVVLQFIAAREQKPVEESSPAEARTSLRELLVGRLKPEDIVPVGSTETLDVAGWPARLYRPLDPSAHPTLVYFHGGAFVMGDLDTHDQTCRRICRGADAAVLSVDYRLAPEHPFPAGLDDCLAALDWTASRLHELGGRDVLAVGGDSTGATLAAVCAQERRHVVHAQLLLYPLTDLAGDYPSRHANGEGYFLTTSALVWSLAHYLAGADVALDDPRVSPLYGDLPGVPPAVVATAELDPLRDEGDAYAAALTAAGVLVDHVRYDGLIHGFAEMGPFSTAAADATDDVIRRFRAVAHV